MPADAALFWKLALRNVLRQRVRNGLTLLAIVAGVVALIISGGFVQDIYVQLGETLIHTQSGHLQIARQGYFEKGSRTPEKFIIEDDRTLRPQVKSYPGVTDTMGRLYFSGLLSNGRSDLPIIAEGIEPEPEARLGSALRLTAGRSLKEGDRNGVMVGQGLAHALKLAPGDNVTLLVNTAAGALNTLDFEVVGIFQTFSKDYDARAVRLPLTDAQELVGTTGFNTLVIVLEETAATQSIANQMVSIATPQGLEVKTWMELNDFYAKTVDLYEAQFGVLRLIILIMVTLGVANSINMSVFERIGEFGTMRAIGNRARDIVALVVTEGMLIGLVGASLGTVIGSVAAFMISAIGIPMPPPPNSDLGYTARILLTPSVIAGAFMVGFIATPLATVLPALRAARLPVVEALRQNV